MNVIRKPPRELTIEELDRELIIKGSRFLQDEHYRLADQVSTAEHQEIMTHLKRIYQKAASLSHHEDFNYLDTYELAKLIISKTMETEGDTVRGRWYTDNLMDVYKVQDKHIRQNIESVVAICQSKSLIDTGNKTSLLSVSNYGKEFNLCDNEPFRHQPITTGRLCTGFLVKDDIVATAGHCLCNASLHDLRFVFGYRMSDSYTANTEIPNEKIYRGIEIIHKEHNHFTDKSDWALVKLDRKVIGQYIALLTKNEIAPGTSVYVLGHPVGLPLKYGPGVKVEDPTDVFFSAKLDVYTGNSGSPVFDSESHEVVGIVVRGDKRDFRWTGRGWMSVQYPCKEFQSEKPQCTKTSQFIHYL